MENAWFLVPALFFSIQLIPIDGNKYGENLKRSQYRTFFSVTKSPSDGVHSTVNSNEMWKTNSNQILLYPRKGDCDRYYPPQTCPNCTQPIKNCCDMNDNMVLNLSNTGIQKIDKTFIHSPHLKILYLNDNNITEVSSMAFHGLAKLEFLYLSNNNISLDKLLYLKGHDALKTLVLDDNKRKLSDGSVKEVFDSMPRLNELSLKRDAITEFAVNLNEFAPSLTKLYLSGNKITSVDFLNDVPKTLSHLHLDNNDIGYLNGDKLKNLEELFVHGNKIMEVCAKKSCVKDEDERLTLAGMTRLVKLNASSNDISNVAEDSFEDTKHLVELDLSNNKITDLPNDVFKGLLFLEMLRVNKNQLTLLPNLCSLSRLKSLDLSNNRIVFVTRNSFCTNQSINGLNNLRMLQRLDLSGNQIAIFPIDLFSEPNYLKVLLLKDNNIGNINDLFDTNLNTLEELHLEGNPLFYVSAKFLPNLKIHLQRYMEKTEMESVTTTAATTESGFF